MRPGRGGSSGQSAVAALLIPLMLLLPAVAPQEFNEQIGNLWDVGRQVAAEGRYGS